MFLNVFLRSKKRGPQNTRVARAGKSKKRARGSPIRYRGKKTTNKHKYISLKPRRAIKKKISFKTIRIS